MNGADIAKINFKIVAGIKKELRLQGHYLTGDLERSFTEKQSNTNNDIFFEAYAFAFLQDLEQGVEAEKIGELDVYSKEFAQLVYWVGQRGTFKGNHFIIAKNIWNKWREEGKPLETSKKFSKTGEIKGAISAVFNRNDNKYMDEIDELAVKEIDKILFQ